MYLIEDKQGNENLVKVFLSKTFLVGSTRPPPYPHATVEIITKFVFIIISIVIMILFAEKNNNNNFSIFNHFHLVL